MWNNLPFLLVWFIAAQTQYNSRCGLWQDCDIIQMIINQTAHCYIIQMIINQTAHCDIIQMIINQTAHCDIIQMNKLGANDNRWNSDMLHNPMEHT